MRTTVCCRSVAAPASLLLINAAAGGSVAPVVWRPPAGGLNATSRRRQSVGRLLLLQKLEAKTGIPKLHLFLGGYAFRPAHVRWSDVRSTTLAASLHLRMIHFPVADE